MLSKKINQEPSDIDKDSNSEGIPPTSKDIEPNKGKHEIRYRNFEALGLLYLIAVV